MKTNILKGKVVHGKGLGRTVGMPTANLQPYEGEKIPEYGVYATKIKVCGRSYCAVTNVGTRPSVDNEQDVTIESYILDFSEDIYDAEVQLEFVQYIRPIRKFENLEAVKQQVVQDIKKVRKCFK